MRRASLLNNTSNANENFFEPHHSLMNSPRNRTKRTRGPLAQQYGHFDPPLWSRRGGGADAPHRGCVKKGAFYAFLL